uniref:Uncharacterized protein n=1 Tax=Panagrolaimus superbus TaxID=310955 RepID=A0A914XWH4_9BILA
MAPVDHSCEAITYQEAIKQQNQIKAKKNVKKTVVGGGGGSGPSGDNDRPRGDDEEVDDGFEEDVDDKTDIRERNPTYINNLPKREILPANYKFGVDKKNTEKARVFVFEENNRSLVHHYSKFNEKYYCRGCFNFCGRKVFSLFKNDIFCVPPIHLCKPETYEKLMEEQRKIKEKYEEMAKASAATFQQASSSSSAAIPRQYFSIAPAVASITFKLKPIEIKELEKLQNPRQAQKAASSSVPRRTISTNLSPDFRQADLMDFHYAFDENGGLKQRLVVYEPDRKFIREYVIQETGVWKCLNCEIGTAIKDDEFVTCSIKHECEPIPTLVSKERQKVYEALWKANRDASSGNSRNPMSDMSFQQNGSSPRNNKRMSIFGTVEHADTMNKKPRNSFGPTSDLCGRENFNIGFNGASSSTNYSASGSQRSQFDGDNAVKLYKPSSYTLEKLCQKLDIDYCEKAYLFWHNIKIEKVSLSSKPGQVYPITTIANPGFSAISLYLTGSEEFASKVKEGLNKYFIVNHKTLGETLGQDLARLDHPLVCQTLYQESATDLHFEIIVHLFKCRIGIICEGYWKRYGNWNDAEADIPIILLEKKNDNYFPILSFRTYF